MAARLPGSIIYAKSTLLHRILSHALRQLWASVIIFDSKGSDLHHDDSLSGIHYYGAEQVGDFAFSLGR